MFHQLLTIVNVHILRKHALGNSTSDITFVGLLLLQQELLDEPLFFLAELGKIVVNFLAPIFDFLDLLLIVFHLCFN